MHGSEHKHDVHLVAGEQAPCPLKWHCAFSKQPAVTWKQHAKTAGCCSAERLSPSARQAAVAVRWVMSSNSVSQDCSAQEALQSLSTALLRVPHLEREVRTVAI